jgi:hypothetical protein
MKQFIDFENLLFIFIGKNLIENDSSRPDFIGLRISCYIVLRILSSN